jgi:carboxymethylenebutenolidase
MALKDYLVREVALDCEDGLLSRREALRRLSLLGVTGAAAVALLAACGDDDDAPAATDVATGAISTAAVATTASTSA